MSWLLELLLMLYGDSGSVGSPHEPVIIIVW